jgi:hypothetical protein
VATFNVKLVVNVPGLGDKTVDQTGIQAASAAEAISKAMANISMRATLVQETAP